MATKLEEVKETLSAQFQAETDQEKIGMLSGLINKVDEALQEQQKSSETYNALLKDYKDIILKSGNTIKSGQMPVDQARGKNNKVTDIDSFLKTKYNEMLNENKN